MFTYPVWGGGQTVDLLNGLAAWWTFDETTGNRVDSVASLALSPTGVVSYATGKQSNALDLTNPGYLSNTSAGAMTPPSGDYSLACWVKFDVLVGSATVYSNNTSGAVGYSLQQRDVSGTLYPSFLVKDSANSNSYEVVHSDALSTATWYFVYTQYDSATNKIGISINAAALQEDTGPSASYTGTNDFCVGARLGVGLYMDGLVDELAKWDRKLNSAEITELYNGGSGVTYTDL